MGVSDRIGKVADATYTAPTMTYSAAAAQTSKALAITWSSNTPTSSTTATVADGAVITSAETGVLFASMEDQITAIRVDLENLRAAQVLVAADNVLQNTSEAQAAVDSAAMLAQMNSGE